MCDSARMPDRWPARAASARKCTTLVGVSVHRPADVDKPEARHACRARCPPSGGRGRPVVRDRTEARQLDGDGGAAMTSRVRLDPGLCGGAPRCDRGADRMPAPIATVRCPGCGFARTRSETPRRGRSGRSGPGTRLRSTVEGSSEGIELQLSVRSALQEVVRRLCAETRVHRRARIILLAHEGASDPAVARTGARPRVAEARGGDTRRWPRRPAAPRAAARSLGARPSSGRRRRSPREFGVARNVRTHGTLAQALAYAEFVNLITLSTIGEIRAACSAPSTPRSALRRRLRYAPRDAEVTRRVTMVLSTACEASSTSVPAASITRSAAAGSS